MYLTDHAIQRLMSRHRIGDYTMVARLLRTCATVVDVKQDGKHIREVKHGTQRLHAVVSEDGRTVLTFVPPKKYPRLPWWVQEYWLEGRR